MAVALYTAVLYHSLLIINPKRLVVHLSKLQACDYEKLRKLSVGTAHCFALNLISGVVVAGIDAGKVFNTWPTMNGKLVPNDYWNEKKGWKNIFENCATT